MMDEELKAKWVAALRSGEYKQGDGQLRTTDGGQYCCLGVLCDVSGVGEWVSQTNRLDAFALDGDMSATTIPESLLVRIGLDIESQGDLWRMNDLEKMSFAAIADHIEANL